MKKHLLRHLAVLLLAAGAAAGAVAPNYRPRAIKLVGEYLQNADPDNDAGWKKFSAERKIGSGELAKACQSALETARTIVKGGTPADSPHFQPVLEDTLGVEPRGRSIESGDESTSGGSGKGRTGTGDSGNGDTAHIKSTGAISFFHSGVRKLAPYSLRLDTTGATPRGFLDKSGGDTPMFLEFVYSNRWAWNDGRLKDADRIDGLNKKRPLDTHGVPLGRKVSGGTGWGGWNLGDANWLDFDTRLGFTFAKDTKLEPGAIAGSGDVGIELSLARHIARGFLLNADGSYSVNAEIAYGLTTDASAFDSRRRWFAGLSYTGSYGGWGSNGGTVLMQVRVGYANLDAVQFKDPATREIVLTNGDMPAFKPRGAAALEAEIIYPLSKDSHLTMGARLYDNISPAPWTVHLGYTTSLGDIAKALLPGGDGNGASDKPAAAVPERGTGEEGKRKPAVSAPPRF